MFASLLIANRGEIACRIIRTARKLGIRTVAVYSEADAEAPHVRLADAAVAIGPAPAAESYLVAERIIEAARQTGAEAIHPGYGFLSENAAFAEAVEAAGLVWVGPAPASIRAMGLKDAAKDLMQKAGVPTTPGYLGEDQSDARLKTEADTISYPVLIKAVAGGGGKGMRKVETADAFADALASCRREAKAAFGDDRVLLEKWVTNPRHIEVQVFGDTHGNIVHLFERDCTLQRRHQKVIEEAPAPGMDAATREAFGQAAARAAAAVDYVGAGTIEFIADGSGPLSAERIWFMEMNTRLQVEHPVTEMITGEDLVEWQLRVAAGEPLPKSQDELSIKGWAMEARLYAENPSNRFLPSTGPLDVLALPEDKVRVDSGVAQGGAVTPYYDPMIAKLVAHDTTRDRARAALADACDSVATFPVHNNAGFLARLLRADAFAAGTVSTGYIEDHLKDLGARPEPGASALSEGARRLVAQHRDTRSAMDAPWHALTGFRLGADPDLETRIEMNGEVHMVTLSDGGDQGHTFYPCGDGLLLVENGWPFHLTLPRTHGTASDEAGSDGAILAPMPGHVLEVAVAEGETVKKGQKLAVLEAMKMEHVLYAPMDGTVAGLAAAEGAQVPEGLLLLRIESEESGT